MEKILCTNYLEQDIPALGIKIPSAALRRFWMMLAHYHGQTLNCAELGRSFGASDKTIRHYVDILTSTFMVRALQPWFENIKKRQVKAPKVYFRDSGIYHTLLGIENADQINFHPKLVASWEGFAIEEIIRAKGVEQEECYFWSTHAGAEIDLLIFSAGKKIGFEIKYTDQPGTTKSLRAAIETLQLDQTFVVHPGYETFMLDENIQAIGLETLCLQNHQNSSL